MTRDKRIENFIKARAAFLVSNKAELDRYLAEKREDAATEALNRLAEEYDITMVGHADLERVSGEAASRAVAHIRLDDLPPRFFIDEPYFAQRKPTKARTAVIEAARAFLSLDGSA